MLARRLQMSSGTAAPPVGGGGGGWLSEVDADNPVAHLRLDDMSGTTAVDRTGNSNDGTYVGSPTLGSDSLVADSGDSAVTFDGTSDYITWNTIAGDLAGSDFTLEGWFKPNSFTSGNEDVVFAINTSTGGNRAVLRWATNGQFRLDVATQTTTTAASPVVDRYHVVWTYSSGTHTVYVNGSSVATAAESITVASNDQISIGQEFDGGSASDFFAGRVDECVAYDSALSSARVTAHYESVSVPFNPIDLYLSETNCEDMVWASDPDWSDPGDGNAVSSWRNPFDVDPAQATGANQPTYRASTTAYNDRPTVEFDGNDWLYANVSNPSGNYTVVVVGNTGGANGTAETLACSQNLASNWGVGDNASDQWLMSEGSDVAGGTADADPHVFVAAFNGASSTLHVDGTQVASGNPGSSIIYHMVVGAATSSGSRAVSGHIAFVGFYSNNTRDADIQALEAELADYYGITLA